MATRELDLTQGGPNQNGSDLGVTGGTDDKRHLTTANSGNWVAPTPAISDPFATIAAPGYTGGRSGANPGYTGCRRGARSEAVVATCHLPTHGYQDAGKAAMLYTSGTLYAECDQHIQESLLLDPGVYYLHVNFSGESNTCMRPSVWLETTAAE